MAADSLSQQMINNPRGLHNVLVARFSALGDVAMTIPVLYSVCACYPDVRFTLLTRSGMVGMFINRPPNLDVEGVDLEQYNGVRGLWRLFGEMRRKYRIDAFADRLAARLRAPERHTRGCHQQGPEGETRPYPQR